MATNSTIEWTEATWNPVTGCTKISEGCRNCYAERLAKRLQAMGVANYRNGFKLSLHEDALHLPLGWKRSRRIFVNSMSDLFHRDVPLAFIQRVFGVMTIAKQHQFQILTKRAKRVLDLNTQLSWAPNIWMGVSVENANVIDRIDCLRKTRAQVKFLSVEPLLGPLPNLNLAGIDWVIVGGESGPGAREMKEEWVRDIRDQCIANGTAFFFKQWGGVFKKATGRILEGRTWDDMPRIAQQLAA